MMRPLAEALNLMFRGRRRVRLICVRYLEPRHFHTVLQLGTFSGDESPQLNVRVRSR